MRARTYLALAALVASPAAVESAREFAQPLGPSQTMNIPDVIAPAVLPYLACLYAERGLPLLRAADGTQIVYDKGSPDCSAARERANTDAKKLLLGKAVPDGLSAAAFVDRTLAGMDAYVSSLPVRSAQDPAQQAVVGIPFTMEDEVEPMYARFDNCLKTQVNDSQVSADTIKAKFKEAMGTCASVRALAVSEAAKALAAKGWDAPTRERAAASTFEKVDESWLAMGQQYREMLLQKTASNSKSASPAPPDKRE